MKEVVAMSKGKGAIVKVSGLARRNEATRNSSRNSSSNRRGRLDGRRGLPSRTRDVIDLGGGVTYEV